MRNIIGIGLGLLFLVGPIFNTAYTYRHGEEIYGSFADSAWLNPSNKLVGNIVIPHNRLFTILLVILQLSIAILILSRGDFVQIGLLVGASFCLAAALVSNIPGAIVNLILAVAMALLVVTE